MKEVLWRREISGIEPRPVGFYIGKWEERPARPGDSWTTDEGVELVVVPKFATEVMIEAAHAAWKKPRMRLNYQPADDRNSVAVIINAAMLAAVEDGDDPR